MRRRAGSLFFKAVSITLIRPWSVFIVMLPPGMVEVRCRSGFFRCSEFAVRCMQVSGAVG